MDLPRRAGHYQVTELVGRGGRGLVYRAADTRTGSRVALKSLPYADPAALMRFKQELDQPRSARRSRRSLPPWSS
jgi:serine/threonine protein kinase